MIGDVHGCLEELQELVETRGINKENTIFVFCGDIINKGPSSAATLKYVRDLPNMYAVRGNHEEHILRHCQQMCSNPYISLPEKYHWIRDLREEDIAYLYNLPYTLSLPSLNAIIVHAGLYPWTPLHHQQLEDMVFLRDIVGVDDERPTASKNMGEGVPWASCWSGPQHVYFGHDARRGLQEFRFCTGLDTGCVHGGSLTAKYLTGSKQLIKVKAKQVHKVSTRPVQYGHGILLSYFLIILKNKTNL